MEQVGYDTYCKLLDEVVKEMQGIEINQEDDDVQIDLNISSYIPDEFIEDSASKIEIYQNIALCRTEEDIQNVIDEIIDRYGNMPREIENLIEIARIKYLAKQGAIIKITGKKEAIVFNFNPAKFKMEIVDDLLKKYRNQIRFSPAKDPYITLKLETTSEEKILKQIKEFLKDLN